MVNIVTLLEEIGALRAIALLALLDIHLANLFPLRLPGSGLGPASLLGCCGACLPSWGGSDRISRSTSREAYKD